MVGGNSTCSNMWLAGLPAADLAESSPHEHRSSRDAAAAVVMSCHGRWMAGQAVGEAVCIAAVSCAWLEKCRVEEDGWAPERLRRGSENKQLCALQAMGPANVFQVLFVRAGLRRARKLSGAVALAIESSYYVSGASSS